jgi:hypothetical protein
MSEVPDKGFSISVTIGPFVPSGPAPDWAEVGAMVVAEVKREWDQRAG